MQLADYVHGISWCYVTAPGHEPAFLFGKVDDVRKELGRGDLSLTTIPSPEQGVITGVTYHEVAGRGVNHPIMHVQEKTIVTFENEIGRHQSCQADANGHYIVFLTPGRYKVSTSYMRYEGAKPDIKEFYGKDWIEIRAGVTIIKDLTLSTLYVD